ncbi:MerR family transcriptional regulator [Streptomyces sp. NPDC088341]|uniref:MerR family transcriptional regulator n=1 Tax=Streptomyces sp. NPDC088341 TaxID=3154870 RepID=UPI00341C1AB1
MRIGEAAAATGTTPRALRFYEQRGLLPPPVRTASGQREYGPAEIERVRVIRELLGLGLTVEDLRSCADRLYLLSENPGRRCGSVEAGAVEAGSVEAGAVEAGSVEAGAVEAGAPASGVVGRRLAALDAEIGRLTGIRENLARRASGND